MVDPPPAPPLPAPPLPAPPLPAPPLPAPPLDVLRRLQTAGWEAWLVGGCVRDRLLGRPVSDWDVATSAEPEHVIAVFEGVHRVVPTGLQHGTVTVVVEGEPVECTTFRVEEGHSDGRHPDRVRYTRSLYADLARRDFTVNAMAYNPLAGGAKGTLVDPHGGQADLAGGLLRAVGDPVQRFNEDGLRPMRAVRLACVLNLTIEPDTWAAIGQTLAVFSRSVSVERIWIELVKMLTSGQPGRGVRLLHDSGLLASFLPELASQPIGWIDEVAAWLDALPSDLPPRLAALLSSLGAAQGAAVLARLRASNAIRSRVERLVGAGAPPTAPLSDGEVRRLVAHLGLDLLDDVLALWQARPGPGPDEGGGEEDEGGDAGALAARIDAIGAREGALTPADLAIGGRDVMRLSGSGPSPIIGQVLRRLLDRVHDDPALNERERLESLVPALLESLDGHAPMENPR